MAILQGCVAGERLAESLLAHRARIDKEGPGSFPLELDMRMSQQDDLLRVLVLQIGENRRFRVRPEPFPLMSRKCSMNQPYREPLATQHLGSLKRPQEAKVTRRDLPTTPPNQTLIWVGKRLVQINTKSIRRNILRRSRWTGK